MPLKRYSIADGILLTLLTGNVKHVVQADRARECTPDVGNLLIVVVHWSSPSIIRAGTLPCTLLDDSRAAYQRSSRTGSWTGRGSTEAILLFPARLQPRSTLSSIGTVTWCPGPGEESHHFPPAWRNQSLCVSWKMVSLTVICCPELMRHILESASRILRAPGARTTSTSPSEATVSRTCSPSLLVYSIIGEVFPCHETYSQSIGKLFPMLLGLSACSAVGKRQGVIPSPLNHSIFE
jgi:hypothetical protein